MLRISAQILQDHPVLLIVDTMMSAIPGWIDLKELGLILKPEIPEADIPDAADQPAIQVIGLVVTRVDVQVRADNRQDLEIGTPRILFIEGQLLAMVGVIKLKVFIRQICHRTLDHSPGFLKKRLMVVIVPLDRKSVV